MAFSVPIQQLNNNLMMIKMKVLNYIPALLLTFSAASTLVSCSDESYDFNGNEGLVFVSTPTSTTVNSLPNTFYGKVKKTPIGAFGEVSFKFPVRATIPAPSDINVVLEADNKLVNAYNAAHGTAYLSAPEQVMVLNNKSVSIKSGSYLSTDSIEVTIDKAALGELEAKTYLLPVSISSCSGALSCSEAKKTVYVVLAVSEDVDNIWDDATTNDIQGQLVADRSGWSASTSATLKTQNGTFASIFDGDKYTMWTMTCAQEIPFVVDLGKPYEVSGISANYYGWYSVIPANQKVYASLDNEKWELIGTTTKADQNTFFYKATSMRYIKFNAPVVKSWRGEEASLNISEFNVYAK